MQRNRWTPEQKADALQLFAEFGPAEAARRTSIPIGTIASWANREGVSGPDLGTMRPAVEARQMTLTKRKQELADRLVTAAGKILDRIELENDVAIDVKRLMDAVGVALSTATLIGPLPLAQPAGGQAEQPPEPAEQRSRALAVVHELTARAS